MLPPILSRDITHTRCQIQHTSLRNSTVHQLVDVAASVSDCLETTGNIEAIQELGDSLVDVGADLRVWDAGDGAVVLGHVSEDGEHTSVTLRGRGGGELEDGRTSESDTDAVRNDRVVNLVSSVLVLGPLLVQTRDRIAHAVAQMDSSVSETDTSKRRGEEHLSTSLGIVAVLEHSWKVLDGGLQRPYREDICDRVAPLVRRTKDGICRPR